MPLTPTGTDAVLAALGRLDPGNDEHWTKDGLPAMKALEALTGLSNLTRADVDAAAPGFTRDVSRAAAGSGDGRSESTDPTGPEQTPTGTDAVVDGDNEAEPDAEPIPPVERQATLAECNAWANRIHADVGPRDTATAAEGGRPDRRRRTRHVTVQTTSTTAASGNKA